MGCLKFVEVDLGVALVLEFTCCPTLPPVRDVGLHPKTREGNVRVGPAVGAGIGSKRTDLPLWWPTVYRLQDGTMGKDASEDQVNLVLSADEALVFFEWLARFNAADHEFADQAEQRVLWDLESMLESALVAPLSPEYSALISSARERVRDSTD